MPGMSGETVYVVWHSMLRRAYSSVYKAKKPTYNGVEVCEDWKVLSNFASWFKQNYREGWHLDKDILGDGKLYSPETCCFVPSAINSLLVRTGAKVGGLPRGVYFKTRNGKFCAQYAEHLGSRATIYLGLFEDANMAREAYLRAKSDHIKRVALEYKDLPVHVLNALTNWKEKSHV